MFRAGQFVLQDQSVGEVAAVILREDTEERQVLVHMLENVDATESPNASFWRAPANPVYEMWAVQEALLP